MKIAIAALLLIFSSCFAIAQVILLMANDGAVSACSAGQADFSQSCSSALIVVVTQ